MKERNATRIHFGIGHHEQEMLDIIKERYKHLLVYKKQPHGLPDMIEPVSSRKPSTAEIFREALKEYYQARHGKPPTPEEYEDSPRHPLQVP